MDDLHSDAAASVITGPEAQELLDQHLGKVRDCFRTAWEAWERLGIIAPELRNPLGARSRACFLYDHIVRAARSAFDGVPGVHVLEDRGFLVLNFDDRIVLRFKKVNAKGRARNIMTVRQFRFRFQLELPGMPPAATKVTAGYVLNRLQTEIEKMLLSCIHGHETKWLFDVPDAEPDVVRHPAVAAAVAAAPETGKRSRKVRSTQPKKDVE